MPASPCKLLVFSDVHIHEFREFATFEGGVNSRLSESLASVGWVAEQVRAARKQARDQGPPGLVSENEVDCVFLGDLFHMKRQVSTQALQGAIEAFRHFPVAPLLIPGNHDILDMEGNWHLLSPFDRVISKCSSVMMLGSTVQLHVVPYRREATELRKLVAECARSAREQDCFNLLALHCVLNEAVAGEGNRSLPASVELSDAELDPFDLVLVGDVHKRQQHGKILYVGALLSHNFGDAGDADRGLTVLEFHTGAKPRIVASLVSNPYNPRFLKYRIDSQDDISATAEEVTDLLETVPKPHIYIDLRVASRELEGEVRGWAENVEELGVRVRWSVEPQAIAARASTVNMSMRPDAVVEHWARTKSEQPELLLDVGRSILEEAIGGS